MAMSVASALKMKDAALLSSRAEATALENASVMSWGTLGRTLSRLYRMLRCKKDVVETQRVGEMVGAVKVDGVGGDGGRSDKAFEWAYLVLMERRPLKCASMSATVLETCQQTLGPAPAIGAPKPLERNKHIEPWAGAT